jgi:hypothetical protein
MKIPDVEISDRTKVMMSLVSRNGGSLKFYAKNIIPEKEFDFYFLGSLKVRSGEELDFDQLKQQLSQKLYDTCGIHYIEKFSVDVISPSEIKNDIEKLKMSLDDLLSIETPDNKEKFFNALLVLKEFDGFKWFVIVDIFYGLYNWYEKQLIAFCPSSSHVLLKLNEYQQMESGCKYGCWIDRVKNDTIQGLYEVKRDIRFKISNDQYWWKLSRVLGYFLNMDESKLLTRLSRKRALEYIK